MRERRKKNRLYVIIGHKSKSKQVEVGKWGGGGSGLGKTRFEKRGFQNQALH